MPFLFYLFCWSLIGVFGADTNEIQSVSLTEGDSVTLNSDLTEILDEDINWTFGPGKYIIAKIKRKKDIFSTFDFPDERFRDSLKLDKQTGSLTITKTRTEHNGLYQLQILAAKRSSKTFKISVYARLPVPVIKRDCSSLSSSSCSLVCSVVNVSHVTLSWFRGNSVLSSISASDLSISLSLSLEVEYQDENTYSCVLNNPIRNQITHLDISQLCQPCAVSLIVSIFAVVGFLLIVAVVVFCFCRKYRNSDKVAVGIFSFCRKCRKTDREAVRTSDKDLTYAKTTFHEKYVHKMTIKETTHVQLNSSVNTGRSQMQEIQLDQKKTYV